MTDISDKAEDALDLGPDDREQYPFTTSLERASGKIGDALDDLIAAKNLGNGGMAGLLTLDLVREATQLDARIRAVLHAAQSEDAK